MNIIKRNGSEVIFDKQKIVNAVSKANNDPNIPINANKLTSEQINNIADITQQYFMKQKSTCDIEQVQDFVIKQIMAQQAYNIAQHYIEYRFKQSYFRQHLFCTLKVDRFP